MNLRNLLRRTPIRAASKRAIPWLTAIDVLRATQTHWTRQLSRRDRERLLALLRDSRGNPTNLSASQQREFKRLIAKLDLPGLAKTAALTATIGTGKSPKRRRR